MGLAFPANANDGGSWGSQSFTSATQLTAGTTTQDATAVACALNIFGQSNIYRYGGTFNGYCFNGKTNNPLGVYTSPGYNACKISFVGGPGPTKRSIGTFAGWEIADVEISNDPATLIETPAGYTPHGPLLPAQLGHSFLHKRSQV